MIGNYVKLARPAHWVKNSFVLVPVIFGMKFRDIIAWRQALLAAAAFSLLASAVYIINDIVDRNRDRLHPKKKDRPIASGAVGVGSAAAFAAVLVAPGVALAWAAGPMVVAIVLAYFIMQMAYSFALKNKMLIDVIIIAMGFVLRATAGAAAIGVEVSPWLIVCTFTICLFMGFCKRRNEGATLGNGEEANNHRNTLSGYTPELLTHLITLSGAVAVVSFLMYATSQRTVEHFRNYYLVYTLPVVVYGVFRFAMLSMRGKYADPVDLIIHDVGFQLAIALWVAMVLVILLFGPNLQAFFAAGINSNGGI